jgi:hypothetical protein
MAQVLPQPAQLQFQPQQPAASSIFGIGPPPIDPQTAAERWFPLGNDRFMVVKIFKGREYITIRQYDAVNGIWRATRNGINLKYPEWKSIEDNIADIRDAVEQLRPFATRDRADA